MCSIWLGRGLVEPESLESGPHDGALPDSVAEKAITRTPDDPAVVLGPCPGFFPRVAAWPCCTATQPRRTPICFCRFRVAACWPITSTHRQNDVATCLSRQTSVLFIAFVPPVDAILVTH